MMGERESCISLSFERDVENYSERTTQSTTQRVRELLRGDHSERIT